MGRWWELEQRGHPSAVTHRKWKVQPSQVPSGHLLGRGKKEGAHVVVTLQSGEDRPPQGQDTMAAVFPKWSTPKNYLPMTAGDLGAPQTSPGVFFVSLPT